MSAETDLLKADFESKIATLHATIDSNQRLYQQQYEQDHLSLKLAFEANDRRLTAMNEFRAALGDQTTKMLTKAEFDLAHRALEEKTDASFRTLDTKIEAKFVPLDQKVDEFGKPNWTLLTSFMSVMALVVAGVWLVVGLKIENSSQPLSLAIEQIKTNSDANTRQLVDQRATRDRQMAELRAFVDQNAARTEANEQKLGVIGSLQQSRITLVDRLAATVEAMRVDSAAEKAVTKEKLADAEQQVTALWRKSFGVTLPTK